jgi:uracil-DNA glycosylase
MDRDQLQEHLRFAAELGVAGVSRDPVWRTRPHKGVGSPLETASSEMAQKSSFSAGDRQPAPDPSRMGSSLETASSEMAQKSSFSAGSGQPAPDPLMVFRGGAEALVAIRDDLGDCTRCKLHTLGRRQIVYGVGNPDADLMFVGEAPGADEDLQGEPFVGRAGQLLTKIIEAINLRRDDVYIANVIKCRPPGNRNPEPDEVDQCEPFLFRQIEVVKPKVIVALGKFAAQTLLRTLDPISRLRGRVYDYRGAKLIPTFHPAYLLRNPASKREVWEDMKLVRSLLKSEA